MTLKTQGLQTLEQIQAFLDGTQTLGFEAPAKAASYEWIAAELKRWGYFRLSKGGKGLLRRYLEKVTGLSRAQLSRLIVQFRDSGRIHDRRGRPAKPFTRRYTAVDVRLLAELDALHGTLSGLATRKLCERAWVVHGDQRFARLAGISNGHLYNLRHATGYQRQRRQVDKTRPSPVKIGERRKPFPDGRPGFLRVDEVTQMQVVVSVERISERYLLPTLKQLLEAFPFVILGFHADNGSEYINTHVAQLLEKLRIELTKSRARQTNDNALVESKNGSVVRKHLGYAHIPGRFAQQVNDFAVHVLTPYLNFHRPCLFPEEIIDAKGKRRKRYPYAKLMTPYEKLKSLPDAGQYLKPTITFDQLDDITMRHSDNEAARLLNEARAKLFRTINRAQKPAA